MSHIYLITSHPVWVLKGNGNKQERQKQQQQTQKRHFFTPVRIHHIEKERKNASGTLYCTIIYCRNHQQRASSPNCDEIPGDLAGRTNIPPLTHKKHDCVSFSTSKQTRSQNTDTNTHTHNETRNTQCIHKKAFSVVVGMHGVVCIPQDLTTSPPLTSSLRLCSHSHSIPFTYFSPRPAQSLYRH